MRNTSILTAVAIAIVAGGAGYALSQYTNTTNDDNLEITAVVDEVVAAANDTTQDDNASTETTETTDTTSTAGMTPVDLSAAAPAAGTAKEEAKEEVKEEAASSVSINVKDALEDRFIGSEDAPITVYDYSSLTCPHCARFHSEILPKVKTNFINTGKVRWVFVGFPLNEPALKAEMALRCLPKDKYTAAQDMLYTKQAQWAFEPDAIGVLNLLMKSEGMTEETFISCLSNRELEEGLYAKAQHASENLKVTSTPTFILNDGAKKISGVGSYEGFAYDLERFLADQNAPAPAAAVETPAEATSEEAATE